MEDWVYILSWLAILILGSSYWFQIYKIHKHKEVRDLSITYNILLALGFGILIITAIAENSEIFLVKQIVTFVPVVILIAQIIIHRKDTYHDSSFKLCVTCRSELEPNWRYCSNCGTHNISNYDNGKHKKKKHQNRSRSKNSSKKRSENRKTN